MRIAIRSLLKSPGFALAAIVALSLGIGANTAIFSAVNGLLLNPVGVDEPERVVAVRVKFDSVNLASIPISLPDYGDIRDAKELFSASAIMQIGDFALLSEGQPERVLGAYASWQWFEVFGARPLHGRTFHEEEDLPNRNQVVVLSHAMWMRMFGGDPSAIGRKLEMNRIPYEVIGVMPAEFRQPAQADLWVPRGIDPAQFANEENRFNESFTAVARLRGDVPFERAAAAVPVLAFQSLSPEGRTIATRGQWGMFLVPYAEYTLGDLRTPLLILFAAVGLVLLIACSNVAGILLARASSRVKEIAVRAALGASRWRLIRHAMAESVALAGCGAVTGIGLAYFSVGVLQRFVPETLMSGSTIGIDGRVLAFTAGLSVVSALLFGLAPAWQTSRIGHYEALKEGGRSGTAGRARQRMRAALVAGEVGLALVLLVGAGLLLRSLSNVERVSPGFDPSGVMTAEASRAHMVDMRNMREYREPLWQFHQSVIERLEALPGVSAAGAVMPLAFTGEDWSGSFAIAGREPEPGQPGPHGRVRFATRGYFEALRVPLLQGRLFDERDTMDGEAVAIIDQNLADAYWPNRDPLRDAITRSLPGAKPTRIIGVVGSVKQTDLVGDTGKGIVYYPMSQEALPAAAYVVKSPGEPASLATGIRDAVEAVDPTQPLYGLMTMEERVGSTLRVRRFAMGLLGVFSGVALLMAALGLYGIVSYSVAQRTGEIGIRMAVGARQDQVLGMVLRDGLKLALVGVALGVVGAFAVTRVLVSQLYDVNPFDPMTFALAAAVLVASAALASLWPARRAMKIEPVEALRQE